MRAGCCDGWAQLAELRGVTVDAEAVRSLLDVVSCFPRFSRDSETLEGWFPRGGAALLLSLGRD